LASTPFEAVLAASIVHENASHRLCRRRKKVPATVPALSLFDVYQPHIGFMHQSCRLQRLTGFLLSQLLHGESAQFVVDQRQQLFGGVRVALLDGGQDACNLTHWAPVSGDV
jgi:hypothetical protein